jgi:hypothetical protein
MRWCRYLWFPSFVVLTILLAGALAQQPSSRPSVPGAEKSAPAKSDPAADEVLGKAIDKVDPRKVGWIKTAIWEEVEAQGLNFQAEGHYLAGKGNQVKLDLVLQVGDAKGSLQVISDGQVMWEITQVGSQPPDIAKTDLRKALQPLEKATVLKQRDLYLQSKSFAGLLPLLSALRKDIAFKEMKTMHWRGRDVILLSGPWSQPVTEAKQWPDYLPRQCRLYLDKETYWPHRVEWWGPADARNQDVLLMQLEFRNPERPQNVPAKTFAYAPPAGVQVADHSEMARSTAERMASLPVTAP